MQIADERDDPLRTFDALFKAACVDRDPATAAALFADDGLSFSGSDLAERATTKAELLELLQGIAASPNTLTFSWTERRTHVEGDVAWVNAAGSVTITGPSGERTIPYRVTAVLRRRAGRWMWHTFAGSEPR